MISDPRGYIVASVTKGPSVTPSSHRTEQEAVAEASRLATVHPKDSFVVYAPVKMVKAVMVEVIDLRPDSDPDIPF